MNFLCGFLLFSCLCHGSLCAGQPVLLTMRGIEFPPGKLEEILRVEKADRRYEVMADAVEGGSAREVETVVLQTVVGEKIEVLSGREVIYPTEYQVEDMPSRSNQVSFQILEPRPFVPGAIDKFERIPAFETRTTGSLSELRVTGRNKEGLFTIAFSHEFAFQEADRVAVSFEFFKGNRMTMTMPQFRTNRVNLPDLVVGDGQWVLAAVLDSWRKDASAGSKMAVWVNVESLTLSK